MNCKRCFLVCAALLLCSLLAAGIFAITVGHFLATDDAISQADAIVVLGGEDSSFFRVRHGVDLFNAGYAPVVVFSGGTLKDAGIACSSAQLSLEAAQQLGLPPEATVIADGAQSTYDEAVNIRRLVQQHDWHSLIVVTDPSHTRRARMAFRDVFRDTGIAVIVRPVNEHWYRADSWWRSRDGLRETWTEYLKLLLYVVGYR